MPTQWQPQRLAAFEGCSQPSAGSTRPELVVSRTSLPIYHAIGPSVSRVLEHSGIHHRNKSRAKSKPWVSNLPIQTSGLGALHALPRGHISSPFLEEHLFMCLLHLCANRPVSVCHRTTKSPAWPQDLTPPGSSRPVQSSLIEVWPEVHTDVASE